MEMNNYFDALHPLRPYTYSLPFTQGSVPPSDAVRGEKPVAAAGYHPAEQGGTWITVEDHRGEEGYVHGQHFVVSDFGPYPDGWAVTPAPLNLAQVKAAKLLAIDAETSAAIIAGFEFAHGGQTLHFSYDHVDQQNFADTANAATLALMNVPGVPPSVTWNGWKADGKLVRLTLTASEFINLYMAGALTHKAACMERGGLRKAAVEAAMTPEAVANA